MLHSLLHSRKIPAAERDAEVILIPGPGMPDAPDWLHNDINWPERLAEEIDGKVQVSWYNYTIESSSGNSIVQQLLAEGLKLLTCLDRWLQGSPTPYPIFFICHSLGGEVLKKALCELRRHFYQYQAIYDKPAGVLFLGTPHLKQGNGFDTNVVELILGSTGSKPLQRKGIRPTEDGDLMTELCVDFERIARTIPVLSAFEGKPTKVYKNTTFARISRHSNIQIIEKSNCTVDANGERVFRIHCTHPDLCRIDVQSAVYSDLRGAIQNIIKLAEIRMLQTMEAKIPSKIAGMTLRSKSSFQGEIKYQSLEETQAPEEASNQNSKSTPDVSGQAVAGSSQPTRPSRTSAELENLPISFELAKRAPVLPCFTPRVKLERNKHFCCREDVFARIDHALLPDSQVIGGASEDGSVRTDGSEDTLKSFALCGIGGSGKTQVALEYAYRREHHFDAVFWITADSKDVLIEEFAHIAVALKLLKSEETVDLLTARDLVKGWLSNPVKSHEAASSPDNEAKWLLVFDNADDQDMLDDFWPATGLGSVLVTSRDMHAKAQTYTAQHGMDLTPFSVKEATYMIKQLVPKSVVDGQDDLLVEIAEKLGGLPLLLTQMSGVMNRLHLSCKDFLRLCEERDVEHLDWAGDKFTKSAQVFRISTKIGLDGLTLQSRSLLQVASLLDPDCVPQDVLTQALSHGRLAGLPTEFRDYIDARLQLEKSSLINVNRATGDLSLHRVVQDVTLATMDRTRLFEAFRAALQAVSSAWPYADLKDRFTTDRYPACAKMFPSVIRLKQALVKGLKAEWSHDPDAVTPLLNDAGWYWFERGFPEEAKDFWTLTEDIYNVSTSLSSERKQYMLRRANLDSATASMETNDAQDCLRRFKAWIEASATATSRATDFNSQYELALYYNEIGVAYGMNGLYDDAIEHLLQSVEYFQRMPDYDDTLLSWPEPNLGFIYWVQGRHDEAERVLLGILQVQEAAWGVDDQKTFKTGKILYALGNVYTSQGRTDEGLAFHTRCLKQYRATLGDSHHRVGDVLHRLADHKLRMRKFAEAEELLEQALRIFRSRTYLRNELARTTYKKSQLYQAKGELEAAEKEVRAAYLLHRRLRPIERRALHELHESDYDDLVIFWSR